MAFDPRDPYGLGGQGPLRQDIGQSWGALEGPAPAPATPAPAAAPQTTLTPADQATVQRQFANAITGVTPQDEAMAQALSLQTGSPVSGLMVSMNKRHIPGQAGRAAGYTPNARTTQTSGTMAPEAVDEMSERGMNRIAYADTAARDKMAADLETTRLQEDDAFKQAGVAREEYDAWEANLSGQQKKLLGDMQAIAEDKVDPGRIFSQRGTVGSALSIIADAGSYYASAMLGRPFASKIQADIDQDIALQEGELERQKGQAQNELAILRDEFGDLKQAKLALRAKQETYALSRLARLARETNEPAIQSALDADLAAMQEQLGNTMTMAKYGTQTKSESEQYQQAQAATRGRDVYDIPGALASAQKFTADQLPKEKWSMVQGLSEKRASPDQMVMTLDSIAADNGLVLDPVTLRITSPDGVEGFGVFDRMRDGSLSAKGKATKMATDTLLTDMASGVFGATNAVELEKYMNRLKLASTEEDYRVLYDEVSRVAGNKISQANAGFPPDVVSTYNRNLRDQMAAQREQRKTRAKAQQDAVDAERTAGLRGPAVVTQGAPAPRLLPGGARRPADGGGILSMGRVPQGGGAMGGR